MAKKTKVVASDGVSIALLQNIATATAENRLVYLNQAEGEPLLKKALIEINTAVVDPNDATRVASRITQAGLDYLKNATATSAKVENMEQPAFSIITNAVLPPSKRGSKGGGAPTIYPFDKMEIGQSFFVGKSEKHPDPVKTLGSTVSSANMRFAEETGETKQVERTKRGSDHKAVVDANGNKVKETVTVPVYKFTRKFALRSVKAGEKYGDWVAPADGALIARIPLE